VAGTPVITAEVSGGCPDPVRRSGACHGGDPRPLFGGNDALSRPWTLLGLLFGVILLATAVSAGVRILTVFSTVRQIDHAGGSVHFLFGTHWIPENWWLWPWADSVRVELGDNRRGPRPVTETDVHFLVTESKKLGRVVQVSLEARPVTDRTLRVLGEMSSLTALNLTSTQITDAGLTYLCDLPHLVSIRLDQTRVSSAGIESLATLTGLRLISLDGTQIGDRSLRSLATLPHLELLSIADTQVTDGALAGLAGRRPDLLVAGTSGALSSEHKTGVLPEF